MRAKLQLSSNVVDDFNAQIASSKHKFKSYPFAQRNLHNTRISICRIYPQ
ncbi:protein of unknown function [Shewanella benthica]|uniref:Uncharacterized protein n=1 Tax=Shewanella benthica TaxID=43661 RepID=A0A330MB71_9GAMM|nr:protein of unknown function [Shewanella benthica]